MRPLEYEKRATGRLDFSTDALRPMGLNSHFACARETTLDSLLVIDSRVSLGLR